MEYKIYEETYNSRKELDDLYLSLVCEGCESPQNFSDEEMVDYLLYALKDDFDEYYEYLKINRIEVE